MRVVRLTESRPAVLSLTDPEAAALAAAGRRLASRLRSWRGEDDGEDRTVIRCRQVRPDSWEVTIADAVGVVAVGDRLCLVVDGKIPTDHLLYLLTSASVLPRLETDRATAARHESLWDLVAQWYVLAVERVLRRDLIRDYEPHTATLRTVRGRVWPVTTAQSYYAGRLAFTCSFEEFGFDTALNRILKAATVEVVRSSGLATHIRRHARQVLARLSEVGELRHGDLDATLDRRTAHYADAIVLARQVLAAVGRTFDVGTEPVWTFLIRTPEAVEEGIRCVLQKSLPDAVITKRGLQLPGTYLTLTPDLVVGRRDAVADVKYKLATESWKRPDLYQITAFAAGYRTHDAAVIEFLPPGATPPPSTSVGDIHLTHLHWPAVDELPPGEAATHLVDSVRAWILACGPQSTLGSEEREPRDVQVVPGRRRQLTHR